MANTRKLTFEDHVALAKRLRQVTQMLEPVQESLTQDFGARSPVGKAAQRVVGSGSPLDALTRQMEKVWQSEHHDHTRNPYTQSAGGRRTSSGG